MCSQSATEIVGLPIWVTHMGKWGEYIAVLPTYDKVLKFMFIFLHGLRICQ